MPELKPAPTCGSCLFYAPMRDKPHVGNCRALPPQVIAIQGPGPLVGSESLVSLQCTYPPISDDFLVCGLYQERLA